jgi:AAA+ superfamily predicted ATPase
VIKNINKYKEVFIIKFMGKSDNIISNISDMRMNNTNNNSSLLSLIQLQIIGRIDTGNPLIDALLTYIIITIFGTEYLNDLVKTICSVLGIFIDLIFKLIWNWVYPPIEKTDDGIIYITKEAIIKYITDDRKINELYKAVNWYLSNSTEIDYKNESPILFSYDKTLTPGCPLFDLNINKSVMRNKIKDVYFNKHRITYTLSTELINVYTDRERKRENYIITLIARLDSRANQDILEEFVTFCIKEYANNMNKKVWKQQIHINDNGHWNAKDSKIKRKLETIILKDDLMDEIKKDIQLFLNSNEWYDHRDIPYTRGYLFYGLPGTGKTSLIKGLSLGCKRHIHYLMLNNVNSDAELLRLFEDIKYDETILVIEDIDCMDQLVKDRKLKHREKEEENRKRVQKKKKRHNSEDDTDDEDDKELDKPSYKNNEYKTGKTLANNYKLTLAGLLNALDGLINSHGRILIMTTNHPEILDKALLRPGRIDRKFYFSNCNREQIRELYEMFFNKTCKESLLKDIKENDYSPAHVTSVFLRYRDDPDIALQHLDDDIDFDIFVRDKNNANIINEAKVNTTVINDTTIATNTVDVVDNYDGDSIDIDDIGEGDNIIEDDLGEGDNIIEDDSESESDVE